MQQFSKLLKLNPLLENAFSSLFSYLELLDFILFRNALKSLLITIFTCVCLSSYSQSHVSYLFHIEHFGAPQNSFYVQILKESIVRKLVNVNCDN